MSNLTEKQQHIIENLRASGFKDYQSLFELPAVERIVDDLAGEEPVRFSKTNKPISGTYIASSRPGIANALMDNLSQRVDQELHPVEPQISKQRPIDIGRAVAVAADSIKQNKTMWHGMGFMDKYYHSSDADPDVVENRYALGAQMLARFIRTHPNLPFPSMKAGDKPPCGMCPNPSMDFSEWIEMFREWMDSLEPFMELISKQIDRTIGAPTQRIKHLKIFNPEGKKVDITELDLSHMNQITNESLVNMATDRKAFIMNLDDQTMYERYDEETRRYIDVFVVDQSGSMGGDNILQAAAFLYNRLDKVVKGYAMCAIVEFDTSARLYEVPDYRDGKPRWMIDTKEKAKWAMVNIIKKYAKFVGGGTDIPAGVRKGAEIAKEMEKLGGILPNITVVTDDDHSISYLNPKELGIPVNGLAVKNNTSLQNFAIASGGSYNNLEQIELNVFHLGESA